MTMFSSCPGNMWSARSSAPVHQIHNQPLKVVMWFPRCRSQRGTHPSDHPVRSAQHTFVDSTGTTGATWRGHQPGQRDTALSALRHVPVSSVAMPPNARRSGVFIARWRGPRYSP